VSAFWVKLGTNDLNCVDVPLDPTHSLACVEQMSVTRNCIQDYGSSAWNRRLCTVYATHT